MTAGSARREDWLAGRERDAIARYGRLPLLLGGFLVRRIRAVASSEAAAGRRQPCRRLVLVAPAVGRFQLEPVTDGTLVIHGEERRRVVPLS